MPSFDLAVDANSIKYASDINLNLYNLFNLFNLITSINGPAILLIMNLKILQIEFF